MDKNIRLLRSHRKFTEDFKRKIVKEFEQGTLSVCQMSKLYGIANTQIYDWIYKFSIFNEKGTRIVEMKDSQTTKFKELEQRIKELEQNVGQKQIKIEFFKQMIELAKQEFNIDIKKTSLPHDQVVLRKR